MPKTYYSKQYEIKTDIPLDQDVCFICGQIDFVDNMRMDEKDYFVHSKCEGR